jgi:hypothetical protein
MKGEGKGRRSVRRGGEEDGETGHTLDDEDAPRKSLWYLAAAAFSWVTAPASGGRDGERE